MSPGPGSSSPHFESRATGSSRSAASPQPYKLSRPAALRAQRRWSSWPGAARARRRRGPGQLATSEAHTASVTGPWPGPRSGDGSEEVLTPSRCHCGGPAPARRTAVTASDWLADAFRTWAAGGPPPITLTGRAA